MKKRYLLEVVFETEVNDELQVTPCRADDLVKVREFFSRLNKDDVALLEFFKNYCITYFTDMETTELVELLGIDIHDDALTGCAALCSPETADFLDFILVKDGDGQRDIVRLDSVLNLIYGQFRIDGIVECSFKEIKQKKGD